MKFIFIILFPFFLFSQTPVYNYNQAYTPHEVKDFYFGYFIGLGVSEVCWQSMTKFDEFRPLKACLGGIFFVTNTALMFENGLSGKVLVTHGGFCAGASYRVNIAIKERNREKQELELLKKYGIFEL